MRNRTKYQIAVHAYMYNVLFPNVPRCSDGFNFASDFSLRSFFLTCDEETGDWTKEHEGQFCISPEGQNSDRYFFLFKLKNLQRMNVVMYVG